MSWLSDRFNDATYGWGKAWQNITSVGGLLNNDVSRFFENEIVNKSQLRGSQLESILGGVPVVGQIIKGIEGANQLEDLYNTTGKIAAYPAVQGGAAAALGSGAAKLPGKIENGVHDLFQYYAGHKDDVTSEKSLHDAGLFKYGDEFIKGE